MIILCLSWIKTRFRQYCLPYDSSQPYDGKEFTDVPRAMDARQIKLTLKSAYRKEGKKVKKIVEQVAATMWAEEGTKVRYVRKGGEQVAQTATLLLIAVFFLLYTKPTTGILSFSMSLFSLVGFPLLAFTNLYWPLLTTGVDTACQGVNTMGKQRCAHVLSCSFMFYAFPRLVAIPLIISIPTTYAVPFP